MLPRKASMMADVLRELRETARARHGHACRCPVCRPDLHPSAPGRKGVVERKAAKGKK